MSYIEREALISKLKETQCDDCDSPDKDVCSPICWVKDLMNYLESIPAADVRPVVFCKDCRAYDAETGWCELVGYERDSICFCSEGEKREKS